ncbi:hypothetical protein V1478_012601, partial [Vespula squamosa]
MKRLGRCWDRLTNRNATLVDPGLKARPKTPPLCLFDSRVYLVAKAPRAPAGAVTLESSCVYDGLRGIPIQRSRDIRKQYPACTGNSIRLCAFVLLHPTTHVVLIALTSSCITLPTPSSYVLEALSQGKEEKCGITFMDGRMDGALNLHRTHRIEINSARPLDNILAVEFKMTFRCMPAFQTLGAGDCGASWRSSSSTSHLRVLNLSRVTELPGQDLRTVSLTAFTRSTPARAPIVPILRVDPSFVTGSRA